MAIFYSFAHHDQHSPGRHVDDSFLFLLLFSGFWQLRKFSQSSTMATDIFKKPPDIYINKSTPSKQGFPIETT